MANEILTQQKLKELFDYKDGFLYWKQRVANCIQIGQIAGCLDTNGYYKIRINKKMYGTHRIIFAWHHGFFPKQIDHIDRNPANNKIENLREASPAENMWNVAKNIRNTSGFRNVIYRKERKTWTCRFKINGKHICKGSFKTAEEASLFAEKLRKELHKEFSYNS
jgi:hypothetical protein